MLALLCQIVIYVIFMIDFPPMLWIVRVFVENAMSLHWTWMTIALILNTLNLLVYQDSFNQDQAQIRGNEVNA